MDTETGKVLKEVETRAIVAGVHHDGKTTEQIFALRGSLTGGGILCTATTAVNAAAGMIRQTTDDPIIRDLLLAVLRETIREAGESE